MTAGIPEHLLEPEGLARIEVDLDRATRNYQRISRAVSPSVVMAVLKDNAYGHGLVRFAKHLHDVGCRSFGVATLHEALAIREAGLTDSTILILRALTEHELPAAISSGFQVMACDFDRLRFMEELSKKLRRPAQVHLKLDTGLGRLGFLPDELAQLVSLLKEIETVEVRGVASHFAASSPVHEFHYTQLERFREAVDRICRVMPGIDVHIAASAATVGMPESWFDIVRLSSLLYGLSTATCLPWPLEPTLSWKVPILQVKTVPPNWNIGYDFGYITRDRLKVATISVGAGDGYSYALKNKADVLVHGRRCRVIGMALDQSMIDLTNAPEACVGDNAVVVGCSGNDEIRPEELARLAETSYGSILSNIPARLPRYYYKSGQLECIHSLEGRFACE